MCSEVEIQRFLIEARQATWIGDGPPAEPVILGSTRYEYEAGPLVYIDERFGTTSFMGRELVLEDEHPVWSMFYQGLILEPAEAELALSFLRAVQRNMKSEDRFGSIETIRKSKGNFTFEMDSFPGGRGFAGFMLAEQVRVNHRLAYSGTSIGGIIE